MPPGRRRRRRRGRGRGRGRRGRPLLPLGYVGHVRAVNAGLDLRSTTEWARDAALGLAAWTAGVGVAYTVCLAIGRRARKPWLAVGISAWIAVAVFVMIQPVVIDPLFASTRPLRDPAVKALLRSVERQVGARPGSVSVSDVSSRTTEENAFVDGVLFQLRAARALRHRASARACDQTRALLAHELGHIDRRHTLKGVLWFGVLGLPALLAVLSIAQSAPPAAAVSTVRATRAPRRSWSPAWWRRRCSRPSRTGSRAARGRGRLGVPAGHPATARAWRRCRSELALASPTPTRRGPCAALGIRP